LSLILDLVQTLDAAFGTRTSCSYSAFEETTGIVGESDLLGSMAVDPLCVCLLVRDFALVGDMVVLLCHRVSFCRHRSVIDAEVYL
jgi:hypothetical protein